MEVQRPVETGPKPEHAAIERMAAERLKHLEHTGERQEHKHETVEAARERIKHVEQASKQTEATPKAEPKHHVVLTKAANYRQTMVSLRHRMKPAARRFSAVIHNPTIESASEVIGSTVLRPSVSLGATTTAVLFSGFLYLYARKHGFPLRGSEVWVTLIIGAGVGLLIEAAHKATRLASGQHTQ